MTLTHSLEAKFYLSGCPEGEAVKLLGSTRTSFGKKSLLKAYSKLTESLLKAYWKLTQSLLNIPEARPGWTSLMCTLTGTSALLA